MISFPATVTALTYSIIEDRCEGAGSVAFFPHNRVARFVMEQHARMPDYLRLPLTLLTLAFDGWAVPFTGRAFHRLPPARRRQQIQAWKASRLGPRRDLVRFYESLVIYGYHVEVYEGSHG